MRLTNALLIAILLTGCLTEKKRQEICANCPVIIKDSIREVIKTTSFDTSLFISRLGKDIEFKYDSLAELKGFCCDMVNELNLMLALNNGTITTKENGVKSTIFKSKGKVVFRCAADSLNEIIKGLRTSIETTKSRVETKVLPAPKCEKQHRNKFDEIVRWWFFISLFVLLLFLGIKFGPKLLGMFKKSPL